MGCSDDIPTIDLQANGKMTGARTLDASWMRDDHILELEKRAIFSNTWLLVSHTSRFSKPGDFISGNYIFDYFVILDGDNNYQAFHNVCRHRAYPVVTDYLGSSSSLFLGCKYHGWTYNAKGDLTKAPKFEEVPGFKKSQNGLFRIHKHVSPQGFIFINFDSSEKPPAFDGQFKHLEQEWANLKGEDYEYSYSWQARGKYNWKTFMDGYQECYHCRIAHPGFSKTLDLEKYRVTPLTNAARHEAPNLPGISEKGRPPSFTFIFPSTGVTITDSMWYTMRAVPISATETRMEYDVYRHKSFPEEHFCDYMKFYEQVEQEDYDLCVATQKGLSAGIYSSGLLHPGRENGVIYYHHRVKELCSDHLKLEKEVGHEVYPARPRSQDTETSSGCVSNGACSGHGDGDITLNW